MSSRDDDQTYWENKKQDEMDTAAAQERQREIDRTRSPEAIMAASGYPPTSPSPPPPPRPPEEVQVEIRQVQRSLDRMPTDLVVTTMKIRGILWGIKAESAKHDLERALSILEDVRPSDPGVKHLKKAIQLCERLGSGDER